MLPIEDIINSIDSMGEADLDEVSRAITHRRETLAARAAQAFKPGQKVEFSDKSGKLIRGTVDKVNKKSVSVKQDDNKFIVWRVGPSFLRAQTLPEPAEKRAICKVCNTSPCMCAGGVNQ
jgi:hypothetical protein